MGENERAAQVVRAVAGLAQGLNLTVVAEGIEEAHQIGALAELECELGQGYLFSKPLDLASMCDLLRSGPDWHYSQDE
jgi:EAL domain-containing protein (putative c-di-GMP-specific phosphodiesterase class I)